MKVTLRLIVFEVDAETEARSVLDIKEQDVYMGDMPLMTDNGTFVINGTERVIVADAPFAGRAVRPRSRQDALLGQVPVRRPRDPYRGSWLDFEFDAKDIVNVRIDRKRKLPVTALLHALGLNDEEILHYFYQRISVPRWLEDPLCRRSMARFEADLRHRRCQERRSRVRCRHQDQPARRQQGGEGRPDRPADPDRGNLRPLTAPMT
jgi:DNA-directed RNA polymerase beta subunit